MQKLLLIATLSLGTFAFAQAMPSNVGEAQPAGHDFYGQIVAAQAKQDSLFLAANVLSASSPAQPESRSGTQPSSMAANTGSQSADEDVCNRTIAIQANVNRLFKAANRF